MGEHRGAEALHGARRALRRGRRHARPAIHVLAIVLLFVSLARAHAQDARQEMILGRPQPRPPQLKVLERLMGSWDVTSTMKVPKPFTMSYVETYEWVLDQRFLRGASSQKPDGSHDIYMATYDPMTKFYRFWTFSSLGTSIEFSRGTWDDKAQSMKWESPPQWDLKFLGRWTFPDGNTWHWTGLLKDWKGNVLLDVEGTAIRRK